MKLKITNRTALALLTAAALAAQPVYSSGIPTFDGAAAANALQQLLNWQQNFGNMIREKLTQITGTNKLIDARQTAAINSMFDRRKARCRQMMKTNPTSATLCVNTVTLEQQKYDLLVRMDQEISAELQKTNTIIANQNKNAVSMGGRLGMADSSGKAQSNEQAAKIQLEVIQAKYNHYKNQLDSLDAMIAQYKKMRADLTKDQLVGNTGLSSSVSKGATAIALEMKANKWRSDARAKRAASVGISNRF